MPIIVYTVVMGHPFDLQPVQQHDGVRYLCFTDQLELVANGWELVPLTPLFPDDPMRSSRDPKIRPHLHLSDFDCNLSIYVDSNVFLRQGPHEVWKRLMPSEAHVFGGFYHSFRATIAEEFKEVLRLGLDYPERLLIHHSHYLATDPDGLNQKPVWGGFLARRHNDPACISAMETWFDYVIRFSRRDQLSLTAALATLDGERVNFISENIFDALTHQWPVTDVSKPAWSQFSVQSATAETQITKYGFGFDAEAGLYYINGAIDDERVFISHKKRLPLYAKGIAHRLEWLLRDYRLPHDLIRPGDTVVDIGANVGELGLWVRASSGHYIAFEPDPVSFRALKLNVPEGALHEVALSDRNGEAEFFLCTDQADSSLFKPIECTETVIVRCSTLDSYLQEAGMPDAIRLLKVEAEGLEPEVLSGADAVLEKVTYVAVDAGPERGGENTVPDVLRLLTRKGFEVRDCYLTRGTFFMARPEAD